MTQQQIEDLRRWISQNYWKIDHWYEHLPEAVPSLSTSPVAQASGVAASQLGFPVEGPEFVREWDGVSEQKRIGLKALCEKFHVREMSGFGSAIHGATHRDSDLDLLVDFDPRVKIGFLSLARLTRELANLFEARIDLVPKSGLHPRIKDQVLAEAEVLFAA